jgi:hypothetical protein
MRPTAEDLIRDRLQGSVHLFEQLHHPILEFRWVHLALHSPD